MNWLRIIRNGLRVGREDFRVHWPNWRVWTIAHAVRVATTAAMWTLLGRLLGSDEAVQYLLVGQIAVVGPQFTSWAIYSFTWDRMFRGTYPMLIAAPSSLVPIMLGQTSIWLLNGIATSLVTLLALSPIFGLALDPLRAAGASVILTLLCLSAYGFAFLLGSLVNWIPRVRIVLQGLVFIIISAVCGVVVPTSFWPEWVQVVASVLPVTHGLEALRVFLAGGSVADVAVGMVLEATVGLCWFLLGVLTLDGTVALARRTGAVEFA
jgi:ABC-2 type transport system permease protein